MTTILGIFGLAFALSLALTPAARWVGMRLGAVDVPNERKIHTQPMARTGGLAIFVSFILTLIVATQWKVVEEPMKVEAQEDNRYRFWGTVPELRGRVLRFVTLKDKRTIHNAFPDRRFKG